jgi:hypothetical protein
MVRNFFIHNFELLFNIRFRKVIETPLYEFDLVILEEVQHIVEVSLLHTNLEVAKGDLGVI